MANSSFIDAVGKTLFSGANQPGGPQVFSYPGSTPTAPVAPAPSAPAPAPAPDVNAQMASYAAQLRALQTQIAQQPKIYQYDVAGASAKARASAENAVNPYYTQKLNDFLQQEQIKQQRAQQDAATGNQNIQQALQDALSASQTQRTRTDQDATTKLGDVQNASDYYQNTEGNVFDKARSALLTDLAKSGLTTSGLGQQQANDQVQNRNVESAQQVRSFNAQKEAINTLKNRTFEDLQTGDTQSTRNAGQKKDLIKVDLDRALQDIDLETKAGKSQTEYERLNALVGEQQKQYQLGVNQFIQALAGKGARAQDIQATRAIYG